ncbi:hypothetical protein CCAN11_1370004 [Capnocytophaga canimorsus]|uniref:KARI N-terminal Rossmann domain-containing protein n=1 Tax=Capnocytophaga canimorsus TaxID=28188 RepID=A0A0B7IBK5_9FLAO|nr:hypothetical protein CCAN11_1370004 [Capnocytophaga canimorsus]
MKNYFNTLNFREKLAQLGVCELLQKSDFSQGVEALKGKKIVIVGAGAQGLNQGLNMRDSGLKRFLRFARMCYCRKTPFVHQYHRQRLSSRHL